MAGKWDGRRWYRLKLQGLSREQLLAKKSRMRQVMDEIYQGIEEHAGKEEKIFSMIQRALEEREQVYKAQLSQEKS